MSSITAGTSAGTALVHTADTTGAFVVKTGAGSTTGLTVDASQITTLANPLPVASGGTGATSLSGITTGTATNLAGGSNGTIPYQSAAGTTQMLAVGTSGQLLQTNGAGAPSWVTPAAAGSWIFLSTVTASASATADIETTFNSTYDAYALVITDMVPSVSANIRARLKINGTYQTGSTYKFFLQFPSSDAATYITDVSGTTQAYISVTGCNINIASYPASTSNFVMYIHNPASTTKHKGIYWSGVAVNNSNNIVQIVGSAANQSGTQALTGVRFYADSGNISGTFRLYGIKNS